MGKLGQCREAKCRKFFCSTPSFHFQRKVYSVDSPGPSMTAWMSVRFDSFTDILIPSSVSVVSVFTSFEIWRITWGLWFSKFDIFKREIWRSELFENKRKWGRWTIEKHENSENCVSKQKFQFRFFTLFSSISRRFPTLLGTYWTHDGSLCVLILLNLANQCYNRKYFWERKSFKLLNLNQYCAPRNR